MTVKELTKKLTNMFKKLLSNLPFNPSLVEQVAFYAKRMHREAYLRTVGVVLLLLALMVQLFATVSPPQAAAATNGNDLIAGGFSSQASAVAHCSNNDQGYRDILATYGIDCANIAGGSVTSIRSTDFGGQLFSMGRIPYNKEGEFPIQAAGQTLYMRYLWSWDTGHSNTYTAVSGRSNTGAQFFLLFDCGNLVTIGKPVPPPPPPPPVDQCPNVPGFQSSVTQCDICPNVPGTQSSGSCLPCPKSTSFKDTNSCVIRKKTAKNITQKIADANGTTANPGDVIQYTLSVQNTGTVGKKSFVIQENVEDILEYATITNFHGGQINAANMVIWAGKELAPKSTITQKLTIQVKNPLPNTPRSTSNPGSYDLVMTNVYGNAIHIKLPKTPVKTTEVVTETLPNTGPGTSLLIGFGLFTIIGYFVARSRLIAKELDMAKHDAVSVGGN